VARATDKQSGSADAEKEFPSIAKAYGFLGTETGAPNGLDPTWSLPPPPPRGNP
jgi:hypothetical protein